MTDSQSMSVSKRNFRLGVLNGFLFNTASSFLDPTLVLVAFVSVLTDSPLLIGLVVPIREGLWHLPQLAVSGFLQNQPLKMRIYRLVMYIRIFSFAGLALTINLVSEKEALLVLFFLFFVISSLAAGFGGLPFMEIASKTVPPKRRGEFFALRMGLGGLGSLVASFLVRWILDPNSGFDFPGNYGFLSIMFFVLASVGLVVYTFVIEEPDTKVHPRAGFSDQLKKSLQIIKKDSRFRNFIVSQAAFVFAGASIPFIAVYFQNEFATSTAAVGEYLAVLTGSSLLSNFLLGRLSRRVNYKSITVLSTIAILSLLVLVLVLIFLSHTLNVSPIVASFLLYPVYLLAGLRIAASSVGGVSLLMEIAPDTDRSIYIGFNNSFMGIILLLTGFSGVIVQFAGFIPLLVFSIIMGTIAFISVKRI